MNSILLKTGLVQRHIIHKLFAFLFVLFCTTAVQGQEKIVKADAVNEYSLRVAKRMKDSLKLSNKQLEEIIAANTAMDNERLAVIKGTDPREIKQMKMKEIELKRDRIFKEILKPGEYEAYLKNKAVLLKF